MKVLIVGDVVGRAGLNKLKKEVPQLKLKEDIDFCIVNGENSASGRGIRVKEYNEIIGAGADVVTMGNHIYYRKEMASEYISLPRLLLPANVTNLNGNKNVVVEKNNIKYGVVNLIGEFGMGSMFDGNVKNPFNVISEEINKLKQKGVDYIFVDFHAEATAEKIAMGYFLDEKANCVFGTHTHVQTADEVIHPSGLAYITDVGMTGPKGSVLGLKKELALKRFETKQYVSYECSSNDAKFNAIIVTFDNESKKATDIVRINI
ncbi:MAG: TIGR00282 family metallophosphoesterase [Clostridia bacterium]